MKQTILAGALALFSAAGAAQAVTVTPVSYSMPQGGTGSYAYRDDSYSGTSSGGILSGGTGDLTDGVIATQNWFTTPGLYVGWLNRAPTITWTFDQAYKFNSMTFWFDDSNGAGAVRPPNAVVLTSAVGGASYGVPDPASGAPFAFTINLSGYDAMSSFATRIEPRSQWIMLSEVTFDAELPVVPLPASALLLGGALAGLGALRRRKRG
ncbi:MAG: VPLPA-CTERM sorting domain-containing protein [Sphingomonadales bacterium]|nr:VPLPA-CTERM sorting domain-containing protein [Sphingomonadales bacterium]